MELESIFRDFDARPPTYLIHFKWTFDLDWSTPIKKSFKCRAKRMRSYGDIQAQIGHK